MIFSDINFRRFEIRVCIKAVGPVRIGLFIFSRIDFVCSQRQTSSKVELPIRVRLHRPGREAIECILGNCVDRSSGYGISILICNGTSDLPVGVLRLRVRKQPNYNQSQSEETLRTAF